MSQNTHTVTPSARPKRAYRKGNPLSASERQQKAVARKRSTHKEVKVFVQSELKETLVALCEEHGLTQAEMIEKWIKTESGRSSD